MYRKILLPTDGSELSKQAIRSGIQLARQAGAEVLGLHVTPPLQADELQAWTHHDSRYAERRVALFDKFARDYLAFIEDAARAEGVPCSCRAVHGEQPHREIVRTAEKAHCDLIGIASHGWGGGELGLPGSETIKVLIYSKVPVLVFKPAPHEHLAHWESDHAHQ